jgi:proline iminopeptidase
MFPETEPYDSGMLDVGDGHQIYWETVGNPQGLPAVFVHGGPGGSASPRTRRHFDPAIYCAVIFDQRGCGRSTPRAVDANADLATNTTAHLIGDLERLREHLGIERWLVFGVSWGVTLGLVYAEQNPDRVSALLLAAVTNGTKLETDWITRDMGRIFPREWDRYAGQLPSDERDGDLCAGYAKLLANPDPDVQRRAAYEWCVWEDTHMSLGPDVEPWLQREEPEFQQVFARLVTHYWANESFLQRGQVMRDLHRVTHLPCVMIHGRHDVSGPLDTAWRMHQAWPGSQLMVLEDAGHGGGSFNVEIDKALEAFGRSLPTDQASAAG